MDVWVWLGLGVLVLIAVVIYLSNTAGRLDRLHKRVEVMRANLDAELLRRAEATEAVAAGGLLDPASSLLLDDAATRALDVDPSDAVARSVAESDLSTVLDAVFGDPEVVDDLVAEPGADEVLALADACRRVQIGRRFYNDAVLATRAMRNRPVVRTFRLQGHAAMPRTVEMMDEPPAGFAGR